ncbi:DNA repair protein, SNF2 family [Cantharellus anzutake]|uniref:DNA repair protein, SNF2 family n=1 Tax=Cantharellus anzutake TaxID=1750568 RepID=UPI0019035E14|nr:DNA repair protein, SNF2 family [Cantharellus anzutake]KAF8343917.1 DNA repair protein, SNF2 family [Cantharellus anzutake]
MYAHRGSKPASNNGPVTLWKPFKVPLPAFTTHEASRPSRKRKRVSYTDTDEENSVPHPNPSDILIDNVGPRKSRPILKPPSSITSVFRIPTMRAKSGEIIPTTITGAPLGVRAPISIPPRPLHDPMSDHAIVLYDPTINDGETDEERKERMKQEAKELENLEARQTACDLGLFNPHKSLRELLGETNRVGCAAKAVKVPVVIDPLLSKKLRPHQVEGVKFLYQCTTGNMVGNQYGCIMADEMGLGKTMQCIALLWTLLKQSPRPGKPTIEKCIIACPASLVRNWANEFAKWLGDGTLGCLAIDGRGTRDQMTANVARWISASGRNITQPVMIVSYETLRSLAPQLKNCPVGLLLADEGHRLKNSDNQTFQALNDLNVQRRVVITGTPIQNDLSEYFSLLDFANPNFLGSRNEFRRRFENAIIKGRDADSSAADKTASIERMRELNELVTKFIIRRTNDLLSKYLPVKYEHVIFCRPSALQVSLYKFFTNSKDIQILLKGSGSQPLKAIDLLRKLCNTPQLLNLPEALHGCDHLLPLDYVGMGNRGSSRLSRALPLSRQETFSGLRSAYSGKMAVLERFLDRIKAETKEKVVLISNFTQTLDLFEDLCRSKRYGFFRLDGAMATAKRAKIVDQFNDPASPEFIFLLSSKAGGCGINLIGANRLILFDPDWNPASDQQALARIWRDGQKKQCFVYRFISTGTIEEKIYQRQASKQSLSASIVDQVDNSELQFSGNELRKLFLFKDGTVCETHDTFKCGRCKNGKQVLKSQALLYGDASTWNHFRNDELKNNHDDLLRAECGGTDISFVFQYISH